MHVAFDQHREHLGWRKEPKGIDKACVGAATHISPKTARLTLAQTAVDNDVICLPSLNSRDRQRNRARGAATATTPSHGRKSQFRDAQRHLHHRGLIGIVGE